MMMIKQSTSGELKKNFGHVQQIDPDLCNITASDLIY